MKKAVVFLIAVLMAAGSFTILTTCSDPNKDDNPVIEKPGENSEKEPEEPPSYFLIERNDEFGEALGEWDAMIFGVDSLNYYYKFSDSSEAAIWDRNRSELLSYIRFTEDNLPSVMVIGDYTFFFANFLHHSFDFSVVYNHEIILTERNVTSDINWDEFTDNTAIRTRSLSAAEAIRLKNLLWSGVSCVTTTIVAVGTGGLATIPAVLNCANFLVTLTDVACDCVPEWVNHLMTVLNCLSGNLRDCVGDVLFEQATDILANMVDDIVESLETQSKLAIEFDVDIENKNVSYRTAYGISSIKIYPEWHKISAVKNEIGIFYSIDQNLFTPNSNRNTLTVEASEMNEPLILRDLKPDTDYYYCIYIVFGGTIAYGEIKTFRTKPQHIYLFSPAQGSKVEKNKPVDVSFQCYGPEPDYESIPDVEVHFIPGNGSVNHTSQHTNSTGEASVRWTPTETGATLTARILNNDGSIVSEATFTPEIEGFDIVGTWSFSQWICMIRREIHDGVITYEGFWCWGITTMTFSPDGTFVGNTDFPCYDYQRVDSGTYSLDGNDLLINLSEQITITITSENAFSFYKSCCGYCNGTVSATRLSTRSSPEIRNGEEQIKPDTENKLPPNTSVIKQDGSIIYVIEQ